MDGQIFYYLYLCFISVLLIYIYIYILYIFVYFVLFNLGDCEPCRLGTYKEEFDYGMCIQWTECV